MPKIGLNEQNITMKTLEQIQKSFTGHQQSSLRPRTDKATTRTTQFPELAQ